MESKGQVEVEVGELGASAELVDVVTAAEILGVSRNGVPLVLQRRGAECIRVPRPGGEGGRPRRRWRRADVERVAATYTPQASRPKPERVSPESITDPWLTTKQVAALLGMVPGSVSYAARRLRFPVKEAPRRPGGGKRALLYSREAVVAHLDGSWDPSEAQRECERRQAAKRALERERAQGQRVVFELTRKLGMSSYGWIEDSDGGLHVRHRQPEPQRQSGDHDGELPSRTYGTGRRCWKCNAVVSQFTPPDGVLGDASCWAHWGLEGERRLPDGWSWSWMHDGRAVADPSYPDSVRRWWLEDCAAEGRLAAVKMLAELDGDEAAA